MTLDEQDELAGRIAGLWPGTQVIDRRATPSHGYRAVHLVPTIGRCQVEIQLRTMFQDLWAQLMETYGDMWGRQIRYGGEPDDPDQVIPSSIPRTGAGGGHGISRREAVENWKGMADPIYSLAAMENEVAKLRAAGVGTAGIDERVEEMNAQFRVLRDSIAPLRAVLDRRDLD